jgi:plasmid stability protein
MKDIPEKRTVLIRDIPENVHRKIRVESALRGISVQRRLVEILEEATSGTNLTGIEGDPHELKAGSDQK